MKYRVSYRAGVWHRTPVVGGIQTVEAVSEYAAGEMVREQVCREKLIPLEDISIKVTEA